MRKRSCWSPVLFLLVGIALVAPLTRSRSIVTQENLAKVKLGMSREEVEAVLGQPRAAIKDFDVRSGSISKSTLTHHVPVDLEYYDENLWHWHGSDHNRMVVVLDDMDIVTNKLIRPALPDNRNFREKVRDEAEYLWSKLGF
jgi:SmpA / OmlA family